MSWRSAGARTELTRAAWAWTFRRRDDGERPSEGL